MQLFRSKLGSILKQKLQPIMNAHREIVKPVGRIISLELPKEFAVCNQVEVIILPLNELPVKKPKNDLRRFRGALAHLPEKEKMDDFFKNIRDEWERDI